MIERLAFGMWIVVKSCTCCVATRMPFSLLITIFPYGNVLAAPNHLLTELDK